MSESPNSDKLNTPISVEIAIVFDSTKWMDPYRKRLSKELNEIIKRVYEDVAYVTNRPEVSVAIVGFRDHYKDENDLVFSDSSNTHSMSCPVFSDADIKRMTTKQHEMKVQCGASCQANFKLQSSNRFEVFDPNADLRQALPETNKWLSEVELGGGSGYYRDVAGGLVKAAELPWKSRHFRIILVVAGGPCHGIVERHRKNIAKEKGKNENEIQLPIDSFPDEERQPLGHTLTAVCKKIMKLGEVEEEEKKEMDDEDEDEDHYEDPFSDGVIVRVAFVCPDTTSVIHKRDDDDDNDDNDDDDDDNNDQGEPKVKDYPDTEGMTDTMYRAYEEQLVGAHIGELVPCFFSMEGGVPTDHELDEMMYVLERQINRIVNQDLQGF